MTETLIYQLDEEYLNILSKFKHKFNSLGMYYGWKADNEKHYDQGHWNRKILNNSIKFPYDQDQMPYINSNPEIKLLWGQIKNKIGDRSLLRVYVNGYTYGTDGYLHKDDVWIKKNFGYDALSETVIIYLNENWHPDWAGETVIFDKHKEIEKAVLPKYGRVVVFDSNKYHAARPVSRAFSGLRQVLVFKTIDTRFISKEVGYVLKKTKDSKHTNKSFFEHLFNTMLILENTFKANENVLKAGLYHAIYGTYYYNFKDSEINRDLIKTLIGEYSENLVWIFCNMKNRTETLQNNIENFPKEIYKDLLLIEIANLMEIGFDQNIDSINKLAEIVDQLDNS